MKDILFKLQLEEFCSVMLFVFFLIVTYNNMYLNDDYNDDDIGFEGSINVLQIYLLMGDLIVKRYIKVLYV